MNNKAVRSSRGGLKFEPRSFKDYDHSKIFGAATPQKIAPLDRYDKLAELELPITYQGSSNTCVSCSVTWIQQYLERTKENLSHEWLADISNTQVAGATPKQVLEPARKIGICAQATFDNQSDYYTRELNAYKHRTGTYAFVNHKDQNAVFSALKDGPVLVGVRDWNGVLGGHMMVAVDVTEDGSGIQCINWWKDDVQDTAIIGWSDLVLVIAVSGAVVNTGSNMRMDWLPVLLSKMSHYAVNKVVLGALGAAMLLGSAWFGDSIFGAGYVPVTNYDARTTAYISSSAASIAVNTTEDKAGNEIQFANISASSSAVYAYFTLEPGTTREEIIACSGKSTNTWSSCLRGLSYQGGDLTTSSTLQKAHNAGSRIVMSDVGQFFSEYVSISGNQFKTGILTFGSYPKFGTTSTMPTLGSEFATKLYVDNVGAGGFTSSNVSSSLGLIAYSAGVTQCPSAAACVGINPSSTGGIAFDPVTGSLYVNTSSTGGIGFDTLGRLKVDGGASFTFSGVIGFSGTTTYSKNPTTATEIANKQYVDVAVNNFSATGTAGATILAGEAMRVGGDGRFYLTSAAATNTVYEFVGVAISAATIGTEISYVKPGGVVSSTNITGLLSDRPVFLSDTNGDVQTTKGSIASRVGRAISQNSFLILSPLVSNQYADQRDTAWAGETISYNTVWTPTRVDVQCGNLTTGGSAGTWMAYGTASGTQSSTGFDDSNANTLISPGYICKWEEAGTDFFAFLATSTAGFKLTTNNVGATRYVSVFAQLNDDYDAH